MKKVVGLQFAAGMVGMLLMGTAYITLRNRKRDRIASKLLAKLNTKLNPVTEGLSNEAALDVKYVDNVLNTIPERIVVLKGSTATRYASEIHTAFRPWYLGGDLEEHVYAVFRNLKDKVQVSQVAKAYQREYQMSLRDQLKDRFDKDEIEIVLRIIGGLPKYRKL